MKYIYLFWAALVTSAAIASTQTITLAPGDSVVVVTQGAVVPPIPPVVPPVVPPNPSVITCAGFNNTIVLDFGWTAGRLYSGTFGPNDALVAKFTTGNVDSPNNNLPRLSGAEWGSPPSARFAVLSDKPCDFSRNQPWQGAISAGNSVQVPFAIGNGNNYGYYPKLLKNTSYYFNVKNLTPNESCSNQGVCNIFVELNIPGGM